jgi:TP901 family phage tail tape measure protein
MQAMMDGPAKKAAAALRNIGTVGAAAFKKAGAAAKRLAKSVGSTLLGAVKRVAGSFLTLAAGVAALTRGTADAIKFSKAMSEVGTISGQVRADMEGFTDQILDMSTAFGLAEVDTAKALYQTISSGILDANDAVEVLDGAVRLSVGGLAELSETVDVLTSIINAYGMSSRDVTEINDILFTTVRRGKTTIPLLANSLGNIIPIAAQTGVSLQEVSASVGALTLAGIDTRTAGIYVRQMLNSMIKPSQAANDLVKQLNIGLEDQKFAFNAVALEQRGFRGMLEDVMKATEGNVTQLGVLFDNVRALTGATALTGAQFKDFISILDDFENSSGAAQEAFEVMMLDPGRKMETILNALRQGFMGLGQAMLTGITGPIKSFEDLENAAKGIRDGISQMGPVMVSMFGQLITVMSLVGRGVAEFSELMAALPGVTDNAAARMKLSAEKTRNFSRVMEEVGMSMATGGKDFSDAFDAINSSILNNRRELHNSTIENLNDLDDLRERAALVEQQLMWAPPTKLTAEDTSSYDINRIVAGSREALAKELLEIQGQIDTARINIEQSRILYGREIGTAFEEQVRFAFVDSDLTEMLDILWKTPQELKLRLGLDVNEGGLDDFFANLRERFLAGVPQEELSVIASEQIGAFVDSLNEALAARPDLAPELREAMQERINEVFAFLGGEAAAVFAQSFGESDDIVKPDNAMQKLYDQILDTDTAMANAAATSVTSFASGMANAFVAVMDGSKSAKEAFADFGRSFLAQIAQMIIQAYILQGLVRMIPGLGKFLGVSVVGQADGGVNEGGLGQLYPLATGGVVQGGLTRVHPYANGGPIVKGPHVALIGEGKMNEAVVPLPDGKSIPVQMQGGQSANVSVNIQAVDAAGVEELLFRRRDTLKDIIAEAMMSDRGFRGTMGGATG